MFSTVCTHCDATLNAPDSVEGKRVKCKKCGDPFVARRIDDDADDEPRRPSTKSPPPRRHDDDEDDAPPRRSARSVRDDDAPRPRKKGRKKPPKQSPILLFVLLGVAVCLLFLGGPLLYFFVLKDDSAPTASSAGGGTGGPSAGQQTASRSADTSAWFDLVDADSRFAIKFPTPPRTQDRPPQVAGAAPLRTHTVTSPSEVFIAACQPLNAVNVDANQLLDMTIQRSAQSLNGAQVSDQRTITYQSYQGRQVTLNPPGKGGAMIVRIILVGDRMIILSAGGDGVTTGSPRANAFLDSLKIDP